MDYLSKIRDFEGFTPTAQWDYAQHSNGYGTKARFPGETIDRDEAERRLVGEVAQARAIVDRFAPDADDGTKAALTSLTFNAGDKWTRSGLGEAIKAGDYDHARSLFIQYNKAGGRELPGLTSRRNAEVAWIGNSGGAPNSTAGAVSSPGPSSPVQTANAAPAPSGNAAEGDLQAFARRLLAENGQQQKLQQQPSKDDDGARAVLGMVMAGDGSGPESPFVRPGRVNRSRMASIIRGRT